MSLLPVSAFASPRAAHARDTAVLAGSEVGRLITAATALLPLLARGERITTQQLRRIMEEAFDGSDAEGRWSWKLAYEACEAAQILFLHRYGAALLKRPGGAQALLAAVQRLAGLLPTQTRRSEDGQAFQQFSTPLSLGLVAAVAARITPGDVLLEPSAGTGMLAILAEIMGARLHLNELADGRADLLTGLFPTLPVTRHDAAQIDDYLEPGLSPSLVLMNPPFSAAVHVKGRVRDAALRHMRSALARLAPGGRLVAITGANCSPHDPAWQAAFTDLQHAGTLVFTAAIPGKVFAAHGTAIPTRLTVIDKLPATDPTAFPEPRGMAPDVASLLDWILADLPPRPDCTPSVLVPIVSRRDGRTTGMPPGGPAVVAVPLKGNVQSPDGIELEYATLGSTPADSVQLGEAIYEPYALQSLRIPGAVPHPTPLVQSAAMASVAPPPPSYRPHVPARLVADGMLSDAQLESVIYAGEAHAGFLSGAWTMDATFDVLSAASEEQEGAIRFRRGWFLGDGTGAGKGRQVAGIILDNWLKGRRRALWISVSDRLLEDAQRDWAALGQERLQVTPLSRFRQGSPIRLAEGILFTTYATLRSQEREGKASRLAQIVEWLGSDFDGVIVFDEAHAMANAAGGKGSRGEQTPSQQGRAGLRLQHALPSARVVYVSATGATTVQNLAYAQRLGLWSGEDFPFATRGEFVAAIENGGVAAMEVLARDLKALGLYASRSLSFDGVEYDMLEHPLTGEQVRIYDAYAAAFQVIHNHLDSALAAANVTSATGTLNAQAKSAARSAFESAKQRFFNHLITAMQCPSVIAAIEQNLDAGHAAVVQIVSTGEALMERRLADIPTEEWNDVRVDITPREYVLSYLEHSFPVQLFEPYSDEEGNLSSRPVWKDGQPVLCREAVARRQQMIEHLAALPPVPAALDQILHHFGTEVVAEVTGRARRIVARRDGSGQVRFAVETRPASANLAETQAFMDDAKRILVFSDAGGTGRSYHADLGARNRRLRIHYLLEAGWKADNAIQGFGRTNRTNQAQPPCFRPVTTDVKAQKRFISTIARRLDSLGAITRGQRQTGGQNMFRPEDNLESHYARDALLQLYALIAVGKVEGCSLQQFEQATGLSIIDAEGGGLRDELPPITTFLNRMLALTIALQDILFTAFEDLLSRRIEGAIASGTYEIGLETLRAESFVLTSRRTIYTHPGTGAVTDLLTIARKDRTRTVTLDEALELAGRSQGRLLFNQRSGRAAVETPARSMMRDDGSVEARIRLVRPGEASTVPVDAMEASHWEPADETAFRAAWTAELATIPEFQTSTLHMVSGLLLPIWKQLPDESTRVYRLQTDDGQRFVGRKVSPAWVAATIEEDAPELAPDAAFAMLMSGEAALQLREGQTLQQVRAMGTPRIELTGFSDLALDRLKAIGLISEIVSWKLRLFVPTGSDGPAILARLLERYPLERILPRRESARVA